MENCGESGITASPQIKSTARNIHKGNEKMNGEKIQQSPEIIRAIVATLALPKRFDKYPPITQLIAPHPMTRKLRKGIFNAILFFSAYNPSIKGTNPQNV